jgi:DNA repair ATPase RecN
MMADGPYSIPDAMNRGVGRMLAQLDEADELVDTLSRMAERWHTQAEFDRLTALAVECRLRAALDDMRKDWHADADAAREFRSQMVTLAQSSEFYRQRCGELQAEVDRLRAGRRRDGKALRETLAIWQAIGVALVQEQARVAGYAADMETEFDG